MLRLIAISAALLLASFTAIGQEAEDGAADEAQAADEQPAEEQGDGIERPKTMSGMSILGNEEAPKSLVIIPWKSSELGENISLSDTLDDRARPVDKEVFLRELSFYEIRAAE
ncbi:MAG: hypothetical protein OEN22_08525 [Gammaproteobacteria bacterium]|nr:hypothetical protein [Gammaproteobacteria bacterium]